MNRAADNTVEDITRLPFVDEISTAYGTRYSLRVFSPLAGKGMLQGEYLSREDAERDLKEFAIPLPGDAVRLTGHYIGVKPGGIGIIDGLIGKPEPKYLVMFHAQTFRDQTIVSCGGGPGLFIPIGNLKYTGETYRAYFWKWRDRPRADGGMDYRMTVNLWEWDGSIEMMVAKVYAGGFCHRLQIRPEDIEELVARCGWAVIDQIEGMTEEAQAEVLKLRQSEYVTSRFDNDAQGAELWWQKRLISKEPSLTPDI